MPSASCAWHLREESSYATGAVLKSLAFEFEFDILDHVLTRRHSMGEALDLVPCIRGLTGNLTRQGPDLLSNAAAQASARLRPEQRYRSAATGEHRPYERAM